MTHHVGTMVGRDYIYLVLVSALLCFQACTDEDYSQPGSASDSIGYVQDNGSGQPVLEVDLNPMSPVYGIFFVNGVEEDVLEAMSALDPEAWPRILSVFQQDTWLEDPSVPPMLGEYVFGTTFIRFEPRFPVVAGLTYRTRFDVAPLSEQFPASSFALDTLITVPRVEGDTPAAHVTQVYPSSDSLPDNLLKFYMYFSAPVAQGVAYEHISLYDRTTGSLVEAPFVEVQPELWDPNQQRFTLLFDPGRIKRAVGTHIEAGVPLQVNHTYELIIDPQWPDVHGNALGSGFNKVFHVVDSDRSQPSADTWDVIPPQQASDPLTIIFRESMDYGLLQRFIQILDDRGQPIDGLIEIADEERTWTFTPSRPWNAGTYEIQIDTSLEDVAGNTFKSLFDVDLRNAPSSEVRERETHTSLFFEVINYSVK